LRCSKVLSGIERVRAFIESQELPLQITVLEPESTRTSALAAQALGCSVAEIAKTVAFVETERLLPILVILSGDKRVNTQKLESALGLRSASLRKMNADEVREHTGYPIGGVPPFPHNETVQTLMDVSLLRFDRVWAASGSPNAVMKLDPSLLEPRFRISKVDVSE
jgi:prolyl-tRNA editing enzyme YbaK/EbsC (Cys-tRNA(Pro) deacylase)